MGNLFSTNSGSKAASKAIEAQTRANQQNVVDQAGNAAKYGGSQDAYGGTTRYQQNPDGTYTTVSEMGDTGKQYLGGMSQLGAQSRDALGNLLTRTMDPAALQAEADKYYASASGNMTRTQGDQRAALDSRLRNQGVVPGTEAYDKAMRGFENSASDATAALYNQSMDKAHGMALADLGNAQNFALGTNGQTMQALNPTLNVRGLQNVVQTPGPVNEAGLLMQGAQQDQASKNALWGAIGGLGGAALGAMGGGAGMMRGLSNLGGNVIGAATGTEYLPWGYWARGSGNGQ